MRGKITFLGSVIKFYGTPVYALSAYHIVDAQEHVMPVGLMTRT